MKIYSISDIYILETGELTDNSFVDASQNEKSTTQTSPISVVEGILIVDNQEKRVITDDVNREIIGSIDETTKLSNTATLSQGSARDEGTTPLIINDDKDDDAITHENNSGEKYSNIYFIL
jgi:hypothetical protein